jgi:hypothetical protein
MKLNNKKQKKLKQNNFLKKIRLSLSHFAQKIPPSLSLSHLQAKSSVALLAGVDRDQNELLSLS